MKYVPLIGRIIFSLHFIMASFMHFTAGGIGYAQSAGVPMANVLVPISGVMALAGGLMVALGYKAKIGAWILVAFLIPVNFMMHPLNGTDPMQSQMMMAFFMKDLSMTGAALLIAYFGAGPISLDARKA